MTSTIIMKQGDLAPALETTLYDGDGNVIDLSDAASVTLYVYNPDGSEKFSGACSIVGDGTAGQINYIWATGQTDTIGEFVASFLVTYTSTKPESFPQSDYIRFTVLPKSANWTYNNSPGTTDAYARRDAVRFLCGDTDYSKAKVVDLEIAFALDQADDNVYLAAAIVSRALSAKYSSRVDQSFEGMRMSFSQLATNYAATADRLEVKAKDMGSDTGFIGVPLAGGTLISDLEADDGDSDVNRPRFKVGMFRYPGDDTTEYSDQ